MSLPDKMTSEELLKEIKDNLIDLMERYTLQPRILNRIEKMVSNIEKHFNGWEESLEKIEEIKIKETDLPPRVKILLKQEKIEKVKDLLKLSYKDLSYIPNLGTKSVKEIKNFLRRKGVYLGMHLPNWKLPDWKKEEPK